MRMKKLPASRAFVSNFRPSRQGVCGGICKNEMATRTFLLLFFFFSTVKTRRHRLKQPKFVLRCTQLMVGLPCPIG